MSTIWISVAAIVGAVIGFVAGATLGTIAEIEHRRSEIQD